MINLENSLEALTIQVRSMQHSLGSIQTDLYSVQNNSPQHPIDEPVPTPPLPPPQYMENKNDLPPLTNTAKERDIPSNDNEY
jgi:hypothetical protein